MRALDKKLLRDLWHMRGQVLAIAAVLMGGVATLIMSLSTYDALDRTRTRFYDEYHFARVFDALKRAPETVAGRLAAIPGVTRVETRVVAGAKLELEGFDEPMTGLVLSLPDTGPPQLNTLHLKRGRLVQPWHDDEVVVSDTWADAHRLDPGDTLTAVINGKRRTLVIVGVALSPEFVYQIAPGSMFPDFKRYGVLWMGRHALAAAMDMNGGFNSVSLDTTPGADEPAVLAAVDDLLAPYGGTGAYGRADQFSNRFLSEELKQLKTTATVFPAIFLGVAAFLINVVMGRLIATQRDQIAILKAFGYGRAAISRHYAKMVLVMAAFGAALGILLGAWFGSSLANVYREFYRFPYLDYGVRPVLFAVAFVVSAAAALGGTLLAVDRAARLPPAEGMRPETPTAYRATLLERLGLQRRLTQPSRMILRYVGRRPFKALLTVLGIACAAGLVMVGNYQQGAVDYMVDLQFNQAAREDLAVTFTDVTSSGALHELAALPGVNRVEGFRDAPAILRHGQYSYRHALYGIASDGRLHRALDAKLRPVALPPDGVVLTDHLASHILHVKPGDTLTVEVLEGERPIRQVVVAGITRQYLGVSAYMQRDALNRLLHEGDVVTGAYLAVDADQRQAVFDALNARPRVLGVVSHAASIKSFYDTLGEFVLFYNLVATILAGCIAFGVVYNSARIALSERGRELASLRVLGFTRGEIAYILLGELGLLTLAALPAGFVVGVALTGVLAVAISSDLYRLPLLLDPANYAFGATVVLVSAVLSGLLVWRRLGQLDLIGVLKTRE